MDKIKAPAREGFLYHLWLDRQFDKIDLYTIDKQPIKIVEKGVRNYDAGPDFLNALLRFGEQLERGDVEVHPLAGDWYAHGHHRDPRYNNVILHLVTMDCPASFRTIRQDGALIPTLNLDNYLEKTAEELQVETTIEHKPASSCALAQKDSLTSRQLLEKAGDLRFNIKKKRLAERRQTDSWDQIFYQAILEALGYSKNQIPFRQLAEILPIETLWSFIWNDTIDHAYIKCEAYLFGAAGLLPSQQPHREPALSPSAKSYTAVLEDIWRSFPLKHKLDVLKPGAWQFFRLRPVNFPTRRIASAATLCVRFMSDGFVNTLERVINNLQHHPQKIYKEFENHFIFESHTFWSNHFSFEESRIELGQKEACLLGKERARDIVINVVLPGLAAYAEETSTLRLKNVLQHVYRTYPLMHENEITRLMTHQLFGASKRPDFITGARLQQALIHLRKEICEPGVCAVCLEKL